jgi:hypothetical protein
VWSFPNPGRLFGSELTNLSGSYGVRKCPDARLTGNDVRPMDSADREDRYQDHTCGETHESEPVSPTSAGLRLPLERSGYLGGRGEMPSGHFQSGAHRIGIGAEGAECPIELDANPSDRSVHDAGDLAVGNAIQVAEHQHCALQFRQLVIARDDGAKLFRYALQALSGHGILRLVRCQESPSR